MGDPRNCPTCRQTGATWCPHQPAPGPPAQPRLVPQQPQPSARAGQAEAWAAAQTAQALKVFFCAGLAAGVWWLIQHSDAPHDTVENEAGEQDAGDYSPWEPEP